MTIYHHWNLWYNSDDVEGEGEGEGEGEEAGDIFGRPPACQQRRPRRHPTHLACQAAALVELAWVVGNAMCSL